MKKILKNKVIIFIIAFAIAILQPVNGFLTVKASALPNPKPDLVVVPKPDSADIIDFATRTRLDAYNANLTNLGKLQQNVDYGTAASALEFAYNAAGIVADNGIYKDEYKARIQYIKDNSVLPAPLNNLESEIFFATLDYADMTIGYYLDAAGNRIGKGCIKFKEGAEKVTQAMLDAIKDTNYWSKPFKNINGETYVDRHCYGKFTISKPTYFVWYHIYTDCFAFYSISTKQAIIISKSPQYVYDYERIYNGEHKIEQRKANFYNLYNDFNYDSFKQEENYDNLPEISSIDFLKEYLKANPHADFDTSQTGISFMPAVVPATVPTSGKSYVDTDIETYVDGNKKLKPNKNGQVEIPMDFPQEVPFPEYAPEVAPYVEPDTEIDPENPTPAPEPSANPQPTTNPEPAPNPDPLPSAEPQPSANPNPDPAPDPDPDPNPDPLPSVNPQPSANPEPEPEPDTETDLDVPSAIGKLDLLDRFPFCVPSDLIQGIKLFNATPTTPTWSWKLSVNGTPIQYTWVVSLDKFEKIAQLCRTLLTILFVWGLAKVTRYVIQG